MRFIIVIMVGLVLSGCLASAGSRRIISNPDGALVTIAGYGECETPCTVKLDRRTTVTVAKAGYKAQRFALSPEGGAVNVQLELVAPTEDVDAAGLPDL